ncbi:MAG: M6 family metalloprotease domain-containing protein [bacterium]
MPLRIAVLASLLLTLVGCLYATNPPNKGSFPKGFWKTALHDQPLLAYGDPGWVKRMEQRRLLQQARAFAKTAAQPLQADNFVLPVLLGQYSDNAGTFTVQNFQNLLFDNNPSGTLTAYYNEVSYGQFTLTGKVYGWFTSDQARNYYAGTNNGLNSNFPQNGAGFVRNIVGKADPTVNYGLYDNDGPDGIPNSGDDDGYVDGVIVVYAGPGADWFPGNTNLWPHMNSLGTTNEYTTNDVSANGGMIKVSTFAVCPERAGGGSGLNQIRPLGVFAHEFGHILGLPDLYDRTDASEAPDFKNSEGLGEWCLMATGSWGGDGSHTETPAHMSAWCKIQMGWIAPKLVTQNTNSVTIRQAENNAEAYMLWEDGYRWSRYFLVENRQQTGFDRYLNGAGLLIFHIDENSRWGRTVWSGGPLNDDETHKLVDLEEADGNAHLDNTANRGDAGDSFPGTSNNRAFTNASTPNSRDYDGASTGVEIKNISNSGATMTADIVIRQTLGYALAHDENGITGWGWGTTTAQDSWSGVRFTTQQAGVLNAIDLGFRNSPNTYEIKVYSNFNGSQPSGLLATVSGQATISGWQTISIPGSVTLSANRDFFVSVKITNKAFAHSYDRWGQAAGRSYFSTNGVTFDNSISINPVGGDLNIRARIRATIGTGISEDDGSVPVEYSLGQNYPNPFNPSTTIEFSLRQSGFATLKIYTVLGNQVETLIAAKLNAGRHQVQWAPNNLPSGVYFYRLETESFAQSKKLMVLK